MDSMSRTERTNLCDAALAAGPEAPTLCGEWNVKDLIVHLLVRERDPLGAPGIIVPQLEGLTARASRRMAGQSFPVLVEKVRQGPPRLSPLSLGVVDRMINTVEYFVHLEDIRRAQPDWTPRELSEREQKTLWKTISVTGKGMARSAGVPLQICWPGSAGGDDRTAVLRKGADPVVVSGTPSEIVLFLFGRKQVDDLSFTGPTEKIAQLRQADLGI
jgi:uncharacterized protein (TIGR03085 family)